MSLEEVSLEELPELLSGLEEVSLEEPPELLSGLEVVSLEELPELLSGWLGAASPEELLLSAGGF